MTDFLPKDNSISWESKNAALLTKGYKIIFTTSSIYEAYLFALQCQSDDLCDLGGSATTAQEAWDLIDENSSDKIILLASDSLGAYHCSRLATYAQETNPLSRCILIVNDAERLVGLEDSKTFHALCASNTIGRGGLHKSLEAVLTKNQYYIDPLLKSSVREIAADGKSGLNQREREILRLLAQGKTNKQIAAEIFIAATTVRDYVSSILTKLSVENRAAAAAWALKHGLD